MTIKKENISRLSDRDKELTALGAAIASNCIPCIEYHIPQARKVGLSDLEIREAVELANKVRLVPTGKVLQTAFSLMENQDHTQLEREGDACGCSDEATHSGHAVDDCRAQTHVNNVLLENESSKEDNEMGKRSCSHDASDSTDGCGSHETHEGSQKTADQTGADFSQMVEMMQRCCPDKMKSFSSIMSKLDSGCCPSNEEDGSKEPL